MIALLIWHCFDLRLRQEPSLDYATDQAIDYDTDQTFHIRSRYASCFDSDYASRHQLWHSIRSYGCQ